MAKVIKYGDTSGIEASGFKQAPVGVYYAKVVGVDQKRSKTNDEEMVEVVFQITKDADGKKIKEQYGQLWYYAPLDIESSWARRLKELVVAFSLKARGGNLATIEGKEAMIRLREGTDLSGDYRPNIGKIMKAEPDVDEDEEEEDEEAEDGNLDDLSRAELKALIKEQGLEVSVRKSMSDDDIRDAIREQTEAEEDEDEEELDEEEDEDEEDDEEEAEGDNYESMSVVALRQELSDRQLETKGKRTVLIARLRTDDVEEPV